ncbi:uncharacterized protein AMSG_09002 [Thecamonas trahens ATCC 50062]|uniref:Uncharacterized protein n=1 Tax=Thecamonas trahens ATCC 50062 TaxID=461836 RepID=A0A0L0DN61_THETB|nr:hypothetical protein AMSG_09002 [Thecamonas trahens ATCC 50062]KNC52853.1 hypothetical protein AMSG_09002 [Thecamonas trahens ATCC 50062]|eukprot:XP_013754955.1 hypothetical protein AMSG_09002 [Thecamonas trahens ATCC 50062]
MNLNEAHLRHLARVERIKPSEPVVFEETPEIAAYRRTLIDPSLVKKRNVELWATSEAVAYPEGRPNAPSELLLKSLDKALYSAPALAANAGSAGHGGQSYRLVGRVNEEYPARRGGAKAYGITFAVPCADDSQ